MIKKLLLGCTFMFMIASCNKRIDLYSKKEKYEIVGIKRPKHFQISIQRLSDGKLYKNVSVSKHCNNWKAVHLGDHIEITRTYYTYESDTTVVFSRIYPYEIENILCR
jgi:hypothetical protein